MGMTLPSLKSSNTTSQASRHTPGAWTPRFECRRSTHSPMMSDRAGIDIVWLRDRIELVGEARA